MTTMQKEPEQKGMGVRQRMLAAKSLTELEELSKLAGSYDMASPGTRRAWARASSRRKGELEKAPTA